MLRRLMLALSLLASPVLAQTADRDLPKGKELVVVYIGSSTCAPCLLPDTKAAVADLKTKLASQADKNGYAFSAIGASTDWSVERGLAFLTGNGPFDQVVVGGNWTNLAVEHFLWSDATATPAMPQVVVLERTVNPGNRIAFTTPRVLHRVMGASEIRDWVKEGAPVILAAQSTPSKR